jgi:hypothetical protein
MGTTVAAKGARVVLDLWRELRYSTPTDEGTSRLRRRMRYRPRRSCLLRRRKR